MSGISAGYLAPLDRARRFMERRGSALPDAALRALAREVILRVSRVAEVPEAQLLGQRAGRSEIAALCDALLSADEAAAAEMVRGARLAGMPAAVLYHVYIAGATRMLGERWDRDEASVPQVIIGAGRVYGILREMREAFLTERLTAPPGAHAVFASIPGEVHGIGITMAADTMRQKGWDITLRLGLGHDALVEEIADLAPTMVGLSTALSSSTFAIARLIVALRVRCPQVWIILGGQAVAADPEIAALVDADAAAADMDSGLELMAAHLATLNRLAGR
ncbi:cobalamin B12-binding domain-containing protein [Tabrizicola aquatica]|uniref:cobalamin B12-binding domain-containing protein n=1 Tax=Tabrizicola aquatica TaxID=909926 RepID=UPI0015E182B5|nr:cobalamin-dependent protein [Tabrizicola aquatica]